MQDEEDKQVQELRDIENNFDMPESIDQGVVAPVGAKNDTEQISVPQVPVTEENTVVIGDTADSVVPPFGVAVDSTPDDNAVEDVVNDDIGTEDNQDQAGDVQPLSVPVVEASGDVRVDDDATTEISDAGAEKTPSGDEVKKKILLVEDDEALATVYRSRLELEGFEIFEVHNGEEALQSAKDVKPDLILLDAMMPKISGFDVLDILRQTPETVNVRVIMLTALSQPKDKEKAESLGVDDYLVKSQVVIGDVIERVKHHLSMDS